MTAIEFSLVMNIGAVLMAGMGQLAVDLRQSVRNISEYKIKESCFFGAHCSTRCNLWSLYAITGTFFAVSLVYSIMSFVDIARWDPLDLNKQDLWVSSTAISPVRKYSNMAMLLPLLMCILYFYLCMRNSLNQCTASKN
jgi:hypothetical protein